MKQLLPLLFTASISFAALPNTMLFQGVLASDGKALSGSHKLTVELCPNLDAGNAEGCVTVFTSDSVLFNAGYYTAMLGSEDHPLPSFDTQWFIQTTVDKYQSSQRIPLTSVPSAHYATKAHQAAIADSTPQLFANATGKTLTLDTLKASTIQLQSSKQYYMDIPIGSMGINKYQSSEAWYSWAWGMGAVCLTAGGPIGKLTTSYIVNLPDGAIVDSLIVTSTTGVDYNMNIWLDVGNHEANTEFSLVSFGATTNPNSWNAYGSTRKRFAQAPVAAFASHVVNKAIYTYYFTMYSNDETSTCPNAGEVPISFDRAQIVYHMSSL